MNQFIIVFLSMLTILILTKYLIKEDTNNNQDVTLNFDSNKIKCKCNIDDPVVKENFSNFDNDFVVKKPPINENIITSIQNIDEPKHTNISAESYYTNKFNYPIVPLQNNSYIVFPSNSYEYMNIGNDTDKINNI
jgi:hypothetical protein